MNTNLLEKKKMGHLLKEDVNSSELLGCASATSINRHHKTSLIIRPVQCHSTKSEARTLKEGDFEKEQPSKKVVNIGNLKTKSI